MINIPDKIDNCRVCKPIKEVLQYLTNKGLVIEKTECKDYHFHEVFFKLKGDRTKIAEKDILNISNVKIHDNGKIYCTCHWSTMQIE